MNEHTTIATLPNGAPIEVNTELLTDGLEAWATGIVEIELEYKEEQRDQN